MTILANVGDLFWPGVIAVISATGSYFACRKPLSRLFFFLLGPVFYLMLWIPIGLFVSFLPMGSAWCVLVTSAITLGLYIWNCAVFYNDGAGGIALMNGPGGTGTGGRQKGGGGGGGTSLPSPVTYRRMSLK